MHCIVGLGNPEPRYSLTRHNSGFQIADALSAHINSMYTHGSGEYLFAKGMLQGSPVMILKPLTYMNHSGIAVAQVMRFYRIPLERLLVVYDDLDLPFGTFRIRMHGSDGGNRGMRSIIQEIGSEEFARFRFGIRNREIIANPSSYVLSPFTKKEQKVLPQLLGRAAEAITISVAYGIETAMNRFNKNHLGE
jgi:PTH1 family peptidyl-tRNA hydrolase